MFKRLLFSVMAVAFVGTMSAQGLQLKPEQKLVNKSSKSVVNSSVLEKLNVATASKGMWMNSVNGTVTTQMPLAAQSGPNRAETTNKVWWSYPENNNFSPLTLRSQGVTTYNLAVLVPSSLAGARIDSMRVFFVDANQLSNVKMWINSSKALPSTASDADYSFDVDKSKINSMVESGGGYLVSPTKVELPNSYTVPEEGCFIGYSFDMAYVADANSLANYPILTYGSDIEGGFLAMMQEKWYTMSGSGYGNLTLGLHADVTGLQATTVSIGNMSEVSAIINEETSVAPQITNTSVVPIKAVSYVMTVNGEVMPEKTVTLEAELPSMQSDYIDLPVTPTEKGVNSVSVQLTKVDGNANTSTENEASGIVLAVDKGYDRISVVEQITGTWCGWCPRGHVGTEMIKKQFGDKVITLAGHIDAENDPMVCSDYSVIGDMAGGGAPSALFDRAAVGDPYLGLTGKTSGSYYVFGAGDVVDVIKKYIPAEGKISMKADWTDNAMTTIKATTSATFACDRLSAPYRVAFILSEDDMEGSGNTWKQSNYYSTEFANAYYQQYGTPFTQADPFKNADMQAWVNAGMSVTTDYDNVVVGAWEAATGIDKSIEAPITEDEAQEYTATLNITENTLIQNKNKLYLTALLINTNNGCIVNAAQVNLVDPSGIENVENSDSNATEVARYNANGMRLNAPQKGLNIVKMANGKSVKVMMK